MPDAQDRIDSSPGELGAALRALPLVAPPASALPGLMAELAARRRRRALAWLAPAAAAALIVLAIVPRDATPPEAGKPEAAAAVPAASGSPELARLMGANAVLEQRLATVRAAHIAQDGDAAQASAQMEDMIVLVDAALGANPPEDRRRMLWQRRLELLQALCQVQGRGSFSPDQSQSGQTYLASF